jgi:hypothetical protein
LHHLTDKRAIESRLVKISDGPEGIEIETNRTNNREINSQKIEYSQLRNKLILSLHVEEGNIEIELKLNLQTTVQDGEVSTAVSVAFSVQ